MGKPSKRQTAALIRNRIVGYGEERPDQLLANPGNFRRHPGVQLEALRGSLAELGWVKTILVNKITGHVVDGHARIEEAMRQGAAMIPVTYVELTEAEEKLALAVLDPITEMAHRDEEALKALLADVNTEDAGLQALLDEMAGEDSGVSGLKDGADENDVPEPPVNPITKAGDLWLLGKHRLFCGDSTKAEDVAKLMGKERAGLMNTDPPYGINYTNTDRPGVKKSSATPAIANDDLADAKLQAFLESAFKVAVGSALRSDAAWYMWHAHLTQGFFAAAAAAAAAANVILHRQIIWVKPVLLLTRGQYHWKHEPCFMGWVKGNEPPDYGAGAGERNQTTIWEIDSVNRDDRKEFNHSSPKPVGLFEIPIIKHLKPSEVAFEPFAGSGPQFIAAEKHDRRCFGLEIEPRYCDVIVQRWENMTGKKAKRQAGHA
jgi:DNA modification methylase